jgi:hypothetical protein
MILLHCYSPPWKDRGVTVDITEAETGRRYTRIEEFTEREKELDEKFGTLSNYIEYLKQKGLY